MSDQSTLEKITKLAAKKKSKAIIKLMDSKHADSEVIVAALGALEGIGDEDAVNHIAHYLNHEIPAVRIAACKAGIQIGTEYMKTRVQLQLKEEQDPATKNAIQEVFNARKN